jgi:hypothetical protein
VDQHEVPLADSKDSLLAHQPYIATTSTTHAYSGSSPRTESAPNGSRWQPDANDIVHNTQPRYVNSQALDHSNGMVIPGESGSWSQFFVAIGMEPFSPGYRQLQASDAPQDPLPPSPSGNLSFPHPSTFSDYMQVAWPLIPMDHIDAG